jgi:type IV pilus assembly protein PilM
MSNPISDFFSKLFGGNTFPSVIGLDIGSSAIKAVQLRKRKGKAVLETYGELSLGPYANTDVGRATRLDATTIAGALKDLYSIKEVNLTTKVTGMAIPIRSSMVSVLTFPTRDEKKLAEIVPLESRKYIPVPISEVILNWSLIPKPFEDESKNKNNESSEVLVVAIHNDVVSLYTNIAKGAELDNSFFEIEMFSVMRSLLDQSQNSPVLIIDIGASSTKVYITEAGVVRESHIVNRGSQDITMNIATSLGIQTSVAEDMKKMFGSNKPEEDKHVQEVASLVLDTICSEVTTVTQSFQRKYQKNIGLVYLTGGGASMKGIKEIFQNRLQVPTEVGNVFSKIQVPAFLQETLKVSGAGFSVAVGVALRRLQEQE